MDTQLPNRILTDYPYPIAVAADRVNRAVEHVEQLLRLGGLVEVIIQYLAAIGVAYYFSVPNTVDKIQRQIHGIAKPSLGHWNALLRLTAKQYLNDLSFPIEDFATSLYENRARKDRVEGVAMGYAKLGDFLGATGTRRLVRLADFFDRLVEYRNRTWGHGIECLDVALCQQHAAWLAPALAHALELLTCLVRFPLCYIDGPSSDAADTCSLRRCVGGSVGEPEKCPKRLSVRPGRLYLCDAEGQPLLQVSPFFIFLESEAEIFSMKHNDGFGEVGFASCKTGARFRPAETKSYFSNERLREACADIHHKLPEEASISVPAVVR